MPQTAPPPWEPTDARGSVLPLWAAEDWPGAPQPVLVLAQDTMAALRAARWAAKAARHHGTDVALAVLVPASSAASSREHLDDARATAARLLPTTQALGVRAHAVLVPVTPAVTARGAARAQARAVTRAAATLDAPLLVLPDDPAATRTQRLCAGVPRDVLLVPPRPDLGTPPAART